MQLRMRQIKRIEMVDAWTQTSNRGSDGEDKNRQHEGKVMIPTKLKNLGKLDDTKRLASTDTSLKDHFKLSWDPTKAEASPDKQKGQYSFQQPHQGLPVNIIKNLNGQNVVKGHLANASASFL